MAILYLGGNLLEEFVFDEGMSQVAVRAFSSAQVAESTAGVMGVVAERGLVNSDPIQGHEESGWPNVLIRLRRVHAMGGRFAKHADTPSLGNIDLPQRQGPFEISKTNPITGVLRAFLVPVARFDTPFGFMPVRRSAAQD